MLLKITKKILILGTTIILLLTAWFSFEFYLPHKSGQKEVFFEVERGRKVGSIAQALKEKRIIKKKWPFLLGYKVFFSQQSLKAGEYKFLLPASSKEVLRKLIEGKVYLHPLTVPEGLTRKEIAQRLESLPFANGKGFLEASSNTKQISTWDKKASNLEGYLFPETYNFPKGTTAQKIAEAMISQFKKYFNERMKRRTRQLGMTIREVVILASLIEKETSIPEEKKLVSAVFHNRLQRGMKLDCDPTIIFALKEEGKFKGHLRWKDLKFNSPYNTYLYPGLPPGPICNPGRASLQASLYPAKESYLYFVSKNDGSHYFSRTLKEHLRAVIKYQKN